MRNKALGINSAIMRIINVEINVCIVTTYMSELIIVGSSDFKIGSSILAITEPYNTNAILFPISIVPKNVEGSFINLEIINADNVPFFLSSSILNLLEVKKAISTPEKNADKINETKIITI